MANICMQAVDLTYQAKEIQAYRARSNSLSSGKFRTKVQCVRSKFVICPDIKLMNK